MVPEKEIYVIAKKRSQQKSTFNFRHLSIEAIINGTFFLVSVSDPPEQDEHGGMMK